MIFKNLTSYLIPKGWVPKDDQICRGVFRPCGDFEMATRGWIDPRGDSNIMPSISGHHLLSMMTEQRLLPASVINRAVKERAKQIEDEQGYAPGRKQIRELRERVTEELMPKAFTTRSATNAWIDSTNGFLHVDTASQSKAESMIEHMRHSLDAFPLALPQTKLSPTSAMADWIAGGEAPSGFTIDRNLELKGFEHNTVKYINECLEGDDVRHHLAAGKLPSSLAMTWDDRVSFVLTSTGVIKRIVLLYITKESEQDAETAVEQFDVDFTIMAGEFSRLNNAIITALGGLVEQEQ